MHRVVLTAEKAGVLTVDKLWHHDEGLAPGLQIGQKQLKREGSQGLGTPRPLAKRHHVTTVEFIRRQKQPVWRSQKLQAVPVLNVEAAMMARDCTQRNPTLLEHGQTMPTPKNAIRLVATRAGQVT